eukprot:TRINITY_DN13096_c0_g1_i1.p1 TRINITY_DN13096_c0_g1~~TRINITY_DN13096_c0_g1_i1.p1  ORF type:complete len:169 (+),score=85.70 TRINITY_DN13096_c0_g1_i1:74-580(+)
MAKTAKGLILDEVDKYETILYVSKTRIEEWQKKLSANKGAEVTADDVRHLCDPEDLGRDAVLVPTDIAGAGKDFPNSCDPEEILEKLSPKAAVEGMIKALAHFETTKKKFKADEVPIEMTVADMDDYNFGEEGGAEEGGEEEEQEESEEEDAEEDEVEEPKAKRAKKA